MQTCDERVGDHLRQVAIGDEPEKQDNNHYAD